MEALDVNNLEVNWSSHRVSNWLSEDSDLRALAELFEMYEISGKEMLKISETQWKEMGVEDQYIPKLMAKIKEVKDGVIREHEQARAAAQPWKPGMNGGTTSTQPVRDHGAVHHMQVMEMPDPDLENLKCTQKQEEIAKHKTNRLQDIERNRIYFQTSQALGDILGVNDSDKYCAFVMKYPLSIGGVDQSSDPSAQLDENSIELSVDYESTVEMPSKAMPPLEAVSSHIKVPVMSAHRDAIDESGNCQICMDPADGLEMVTLHCGHEFCNRCLVLHIEARLKSSLSITCPGTCSEVLEREEVTRILQDHPEAMTAYHKRLVSGPVNTREEEFNDYYDVWEDDVN